MPSERAISSSETVSTHQIASDVSARGMPAGWIEELRSPGDGADRGGEALEAALAPEAQVDRESDGRGQQHGRRRRGAAAASRHRLDAGPGEDDRQDEQDGGVEDALHDHGAEHLPPPGRRARAEQDDLEQLAAAGRQDVVAHVADQRERERITPPVRDRGVAQDPVPAPAAHGEVAGDHAERGAEPRPPGGRVGQARSALARDPPGDRRQRDDRDQRADPRRRCAPWHR